MGIENSFISELFSKVVRVKNIVVIDADVNPKDESRVPPREVHFKMVGLHYDEEI